MAVVTRHGVAVHRFRRQRGVEGARSACSGTRSWRRNAAIGTSCSRKSSSSRTRPRGDAARARVGRNAARCFSKRLASPKRISAASTKMALIACGTSWHAALVGKYLIEQLRAACRSRSITAPNIAIATSSSIEHTLLVVITQSGETADTLAALREARKKGARRLAICNVVGSMATREADGTIYTHAGPGDRRRFDQGVHLAAGGAESAGARTWARCGRSLSDADARKPHRMRCSSCRKLMEQALKASMPIEEIAGRFFNRTRFSVPGPRDQLPDRSRRRAEVEGNLVHPCRRLSGRRDEARADRADRREHAGRDHCTK